LKKKRRTGRRSAKKAELGMRVLEERCPERKGEEVPQRGLVNARPCSSHSAGKKKRGIRRDTKTRRQRWKKTLAAKPTARRGDG